MPVPPGISAMAKPLVRKLAQQSLKRLQDNAIHAIKQKAASSGTRTASPYEVAKKALKDVWKSTFGQAENSGVRGHADPAFAYEYARLPRSYRPFHPAEYLKNHPSFRRDFTSGARQRTKTPIGNNPLVASRLRPSINSTLRGPTLVSNVGIGSSRNFSSHGAGKFVSEIHRNVPVGMRALADKLRELEDDARKKKRTVTQFRAQKDKESHVGKALKKYEKSMGIKGSRWPLSASKAIAQAQQQRNAMEFKSYFPSPEAGVVQAQASIPEQLIDTTSHVNETTYLLIPLCPSLAHLVSGSVPLVFDSDIPETPNLLHQLLPMHNAYDRHLRLRVTPLLLRLEGHGALDLSPEIWLTKEYRSRDGRVEVIFAPTEQGESRPDALRITFVGKSVEQVRRIIGTERLGQEDWVHVYSVPCATSERHAAPLSKQSTTTEAPLRMPTLDRSGTAASGNTIFDADYPDHGIWSHETASDVSVSTRPEISSLWLAERSVWEEGSECSSPAWSDTDVELDLLSGSEISDGDEAVSMW
ncbi:hypothetical protein QFC21_000246 [Naganishia friedmannii]|uniref:Uncharacterized protein n=1 Tax=Naganishia friedmannii TaxID=89922 RepID=A0ACC2WAY5_9TREE|nr:hypothetical protein QFC21_000246 [Naganishia friedmannii]